MLEYIYLGVGNHAVCLNRQSGEEVWRTKLKSSKLITLVLDDDQLVAHAGGHVFCLDATSGQTLWENTLTGLGYGFCTIATPHNSPPSANIGAIHASHIEISKDD